MPGAVTRAEPIAGPGVFMRGGGTAGKASVGKGGDAPSWGSTAWAAGSVVRTAASACRPCATSDVVAIGDCATSSSRCRGGGQAWGDAVRERCTASSCRCRGVRVTRGADSSGDASGRCADVRADDDGADNDGADVDGADVDGTDVDGADVDASGGAGPCGRGGCGTWRAGHGAACGCGRGWGLAGRTIRIGVVATSTIAANTPRRARPRAPCVGGGTLCGRGGAAAAGRAGRAFARTDGWWSA